MLGLSSLNHLSLEIKKIGCSKFHLLRPLRWRCAECAVHHERNVREEQHHLYVWHEQAMIEWLRRMNSIVACCHSAKLCADALRAFPTALVRVYTSNINVVIFIKNLKIVQKTFARFYNLIFFEKLCKNFYLDHFEVCVSTHTRVQWTFCRLYLHFPYNHFVKNVLPNQIFCFFCSFANNCLVRFCFFILLCHKNTCCNVLFLCFCCQNTLDSLLLW